MSRSLKRESSFHNGRVGTNDTAVNRKFWSFCAQRCKCPLHCNSLHIHEQKHHLSFIRLIYLCGSFFIFHPTFLLALFVFKYCQLNSVRFWTNTQKEFYLVLLLSLSASIMSLVSLWISRLADIDWFQTFLRWRFFFFNWVALFIIQSCL